MRKRFLVFLLALGGVLIGSWAWWNDAIAAVDPRDPTPVLFVIRRGESVRTIATRLADEGLVRSPTAFFLLVKLRGVEKSLQAGDFRLNRRMDASTMAQELTHGILDVWVTTLEGWRSEEIATKLAGDLDIPEGEFLKVAEEGYMFPDTYLIPRDATAGAVAALFQKTFHEKVGDQLRRDAGKTGLPFADVMILASIVEREGRTGDDRPVIAGILLKRLRAGWPLQADATLQYALGYQPAEKTWWKKALTVEDKAVRSPYNTYLRTGLPPAPISNPGLASIRAVIDPAETDYWYYLHDRQGRAHYARTLEEHNRNIAEYLQ